MVGSSAGRQGVGLGRVAAASDAGFRAGRLKPSTAAGPPGSCLLPEGAIPAIPSLSGPGSSAPAGAELLLFADAETPPGPPEVLAGRSPLTAAGTVAKLTAGLTKAEGSVLPNDE